jgi:hypothetical protein
VSCVDTKGVIGSLYKLYPALWNVACSSLLFGRGHGVLCRLPMCKKRSLGCIIINEVEEHPKLCMLMLTTTMGPFWPLGGPVVQGTKPRAGSRVATAHSHLCCLLALARPYALSRTLSRRHHRRRPSAPSRCPQVSNHFD